MEEIWKTIKDYEDYEVSNFGRILSKGNKSNHRVAIIMKQNENYKGYFQITLCKKGKQTTKLIHRLVAQTFITNPNNLPQVNHKDGNKHNNRVDNLEWCDNSYNQLEANRMGLNKNRIKKNKEICNKPVAQYDLNGNLIKQYNSLKQASNETKCSYKSMSLCALGKTKSSGGYKWKYVSKEII